MRSEIQEKMSFDILRYSMVWEDIDLLFHGLRIDRDDRILSITSAGDNVLSLALRGPAHITAIDLNPAQNALLALKIAAIRRLDHSDFLKLLGVRPSSDRWSLYERIRPDLADAVRDYWDGHHADVGNGILMSGRLETYIGQFHRDVWPTVHPPSLILEFFATRSLSEQREVWQKRIDTPDLHAAFVQYFGQENMAQHGRDPAQFEYVTAVVGEFFWNRFRFVCTEIPCVSNFYLHSFLTGQYLDALPPYLEADAYPVLRTMTDRIEIVTEPIESYLAQSGQTFSKANLSNIFEYMSQDNMNRFLSRIHSSFRAGGRMAFWNLLVERRGDLAGRFRSLDAEAAELSRRDRSWFYSAFRVLEVVR